MAETLYDVIIVGAPARPGWALPCTRPATGARP